jgi:hypothetical protein
MVKQKDMTVSRQRLGKYLSAATNTRPTIEKLLDMVISMRSVTYETLCSKWKVGDSVFPELFVIFTLKRHYIYAMN